MADGNGIRRLAVLGLLLLGRPAAAVTIVDVTTHTVLFQDNFEGGSTPSTPQVGAWSLFGPDVTITNAALPGAAQGSFYAQLFRDSDEIGQGNLRASFTAPAATDVILLQMMVYLPSAADADARGQFILDNGDFSTARAWAIPDGNGHVVAVGPGFATTATGLTYATDTWQEWDLQYNGNGTFNVAVAGHSATGFTSTTTGALGFADLFNGVRDPAGSLFLDAVPPSGTAGAPEPGTASLLCGALAVLALRARRSQ